MYVDIKRMLPRVSAILAAVALLCIAATSSAAAATQHWATAQVVKHGQSTSFTGNQASNLSMTWKFAGSSVEITCNQSATGSVENPSTEGPGTLTSNSFKFTNCSVATLESKCTFHNNAIEFRQLKARIYSEAGKQWIEYRPAEGTVLANVQIEGGSCPVAGSMNLTGVFSVYQSGANFGLLVTAISHQLELAEFPLSAKGELEYRTSAGEKLYLGSESSPHWYANSAVWTNLSAGEAQSVGSGSLSLGIKGKLFGVSTELVCSGTGDKFEGKAENPVGGGAGVLSGSLSLGHCVVVGLESQCSVTVTNTAPLSGVAAEGTQKIILGPASGEGLITMNIAGKSCAVSGNNLQVTGKLAVTSKGEGLIAFTSGTKAETEISLNGEKATTSGAFALENSLGRSLRLQE
jgi:hypothetical protein